MPFDPQGMKATEGILVVEGMIMETGTSIKLSRTVSIMNTSSDSIPADLRNVYDALVQIIDDDNNIIAIADPHIINERSVYVVSDEIKFAYGSKYALDIIVGEKHYKSAFVSPVKTPEIDEIIWKQNPDGSMDIMVSTHDPNNEIEYYRWEFEEDWEIRSILLGQLRYVFSTNEVIAQSQFTSNNRYYCWASNKSKSFILGTSERLTGTTIKNKVIQSFQTNNTRFSYLYSILIRQYGLDKESYTYFENLQKNIDQSGSLFSPLFNEIRGNIVCISHPEETVIGYITASNENTKRLFINMEKIWGEGKDDCEFTRRYGINELQNMYAAGYNIMYLANPGSYLCAPVRCLDCTLRGGTKNKPDFWPNDHQ